MKTLISTTSFLLLLAFPAFTQQLAGTYTVGGNTPDYLTLSAAIQDMTANGISSSVVFNLRPGIYEEQISIEQIIGASTSNTITIQSESGEASDVIIQYDAPYNGNDYYLFKLDGTDHIKFEHLTFEPLGNNYNIIFKLANGTDDIEITNCVFNGNNASAIYSYSNESGDNLRFINNDFNNCRDAIYLYSGNINNVIIAENTINSNHTSSGFEIYCYNPDSLIIHNNSLNNPNGSAGIYTQYSDNTVEIIGNIIDVRYTGMQVINAPDAYIANNQIYVNNTYTGLYIDNIGNADQRSTVINNVISTQGDGLFLRDADYTDVYFNSVLTTGASSYEAYYQRYSDYTDIRNNIFSHEGDGYAVLSYTSTSLTQDHNAYYSSGASIGNWNNSNIVTFPDWQSATMLDSNSIAANPIYTSSTDLRPNQALFDEAGYTLTDYTIDIEGSTRSTPPDIGAYEFIPTGDNAGILYAAPTLPINPGTYPVTVSLLNSGPSILAADSLYWMVNGVAQPPVLWTGNLTIGDTTNVTLGNYQFDETVEYEIQIWSSAPNEMTDIDYSDDTIVVNNFYTTLAGDFTVGGTTPDFPDLAAARKALNFGGVRDSVQMLIRSGTYDDQFYLGEITGSSALNKVTFKAETNNAEDVVIQYDSPYNSNYYYVGRLNGTDNISLQHLTFEPLGNSYNIIFRLTGDTDNIEFANCVFNGNNASAIYSYSNESGDNLRFINNDFNNCRDAIYLYSGNINNVIIAENTINSNHTSSGFEIYCYNPDSLIIHNNSLNNPNGSAGIYTQYSDNTVEIIGNIIDVRYTGMQVINTPDAHIENNQIYVSNTYTGLYINNIGNADQRSTVINNFISTAGDGLYLRDADYTDVYFNSVLTTGASSYEAFYHRYSDQSNIRNNIFIHEGGGYAIQGYTTTGLVQDYNDYYVSQGASLGSWDNVDIIDLPTLEFTTQQDNNSITIDPLFQATNDLHTNNILLAVGVPIASVTEDIDGEARNPLSPYIGADESPTAFDDIGIVNLVAPISPFPQGTNEIIINVVNNFTTPLTAATISWSMNSDTIREINWTGNIPSGTSANVSAGSYQFDVAEPYDLKIWVGNPNGQSDSYSDNDTLKVNDMYAALIGTYTIGTNNADFETIAEAVEALERGGVVGDVTFNIQDGTYQENVEINQIAGASPNDRIVFQSESQDSTSVVINNASNDYGNIIIHLDSTDHIEFRYLTFEQTYSNVSYCMTLSGVNEGVYINNCHFSSPYMAIRVDNFVDDLQITENHFYGGNYGYYNGNINYSTNVIIEENLFLEQTNYAILLYYYIAPIIRSNDIIATGSMNSGMQLNSLREDFQIVDNTLTLDDATYGINLSTSNTNASLHGLVGNNFITIGGVSTTYGLYANSYYTDIFHNNILVTSNEATAGRAIYLSGNYNNLKNNIFANIGGGYAIYAESINNIAASDYNNFYTPGGKVGYLQGNRTNLGSWQLVGPDIDSNSFDYDPEFIANDDLHIAQQLLSEQGTPVEGLPEDIDGDFRNPLNPDIGADEFTSLENNLGVIEILNPTTGCNLPANDNVTIVIKNPGSLSQSGFDVAYQLGNDSPVVETINQSIAPGFTLEHTFATPVTLIQDSTYTISAYTLLTTDELIFNDTTSIEVISYPPVDLVVSPDATIDYGDTLTLTASGATDYAWSGELEGENPYSETLQVAPFETQIYQVTGTDDNACEASASITITVNPLPELPDLQVSSVYSGLTTVQPGDPATVSWVIGNIGDGAAVADWTEKVYIQAPGGQNRTLVGQFDYDGTDTLQSGTFYNRTYDFNLPTGLNIGNQGVFVVEIFPNILEIPLATLNNIAIESQPWNIESILFLTIANDEVNEGSYLYCTVTRSGSIISSQTVDINLNEPTRFNFPAQVTISAGQAGRTFYIYSTQNTDLEGDLDIDITASASGFTPDSEQFLLIDDEIPTISIANLPATVAEGEVLSFDIITDFSSPDSLFINIISSSTDDVPLPTPVVIPPGMTMANVQVTLPDDEIAEPDETITITAGAAGLVPANASFVLTNDNDIPAITFEVTLDTISESAGLYATQGVITRLGDADNVLSVDIATSISNTLYLPSTVPLGPGEMTKTFYIGVLDNNQVEAGGFTNVEITAAVLFSGCNCTAPATSAGVFSDTLTIADNDGATLSLYVNPLSLAEGTANAGTLTIERNTPTNDPLEITLSSSDETELILPPSVTIPAGQSSVEIPISTESDALPDGNQQVTIQASASGFSPGIIWVIVTDINKPDLEVTDVVLMETVIPALESFQFRAYVANSGFSNAASGVVLSAYLSENLILDDNDIDLGEYIINQPIAIGDRNMGCGYSTL